MNEQARVEQMREEMKREWHLDRKVTIAMIVALAMNIAAPTFWIAKLEAKTDTNSRDIINHSQQLIAITSTQVGVGERLAKVEAGVNYQTKVLDRIEAKMEKQDDRR